MDFGRALGTGKMLDVRRRELSFEIPPPKSGEEIPENNSPETNKHSRFIRRYWGGFIRRCCVNDTLMVDQENTQGLVITLKLG
jgi:hypothetical protein